MPKFKSVIVAGFPLLMFATVAAATPVVQVKPIVDARLRYENVDQGMLNADALTLRLRAGVEAKAGIVSVLAEGESTIAPIAKYNAFPFAIADE